MNNNTADYNQELKDSLGAISDRLFVLKERLMVSIANCSKMKSSNMGSTPFDGDECTIIIDDWGN